MNIKKLRETLRVIEKRFGPDVELSGVPENTIAQLMIGKDVIGSINLGGTLEKRGNGDLLITPESAKYLRPL